MMSVQIGLNKGNSMCGCFNCGEEIEDVHDTLFSNVNTERCRAGEHTGNVYLCDACDLYTVDCFLSGTERQWQY
jgi:hypothetical protein